MMQLHYAAASPFVRKVLVVAQECGLGERIEAVARQVSPVAPEDALNQDNPLGKIPCLVADEGVALYDSAVICQYLDSLGGGRLLPASGPARWLVLRREALADGIMDAAVGTRYETFLRPEALRWPAWIEGQQGKVRRALDALEAEAGGFGTAVDLGTIAVACALGYLDLRFAADEWRAGRPALAAWHEAFAARPALRATAPA